MVTSKNYENKRLKIKLPIGSHRPGDTVNIRYDKNGTPLSPFWRRKLKDAKTDGCVEKVAETKIITKKKED